MRWVRIMLATVLGFTFGSLIAQEATEGVWWLIFPTTAVVCLGVTVGLNYGIYLMRRQYEPKLLPCVGGPADGDVMPKLPWLNIDELRTDDHPEGAYIEQGDKFVWVEDDN